MLCVPAGLFHGLEILPGQEAHIEAFSGGLGGELEALDFRDANDAPDLEGVRQPVIAVRNAGHDHTSAGPSARIEREKQLVAAQLLKACLRGLFTYADGGFRLAYGRA